MSASHHVIHSHEKPLQALVHAHYNIPLFTRSITVFAALLRLWDHFAERNLKDSYGFRYDAIRNSVYCSYGTCDVCEYVLWTRSDVLYANNAYFVSLLSDRIYKKWESA